MQINSLVPMAGGSGDHKQEIICIEAKRICDFCFQEHHVERTFSQSPGVNFTAECEILTHLVTCREVSRRDIDNDKDKDDDKKLICVAIEVPVIIRIFDAEGKQVQMIEERVVFLKQVILCVPPFTTIDCSVTGECCCFIDPRTGVVSCVFDFCVVIQVAVMVKVLVPTFGPCAPKECKTLVVCPPKVSAHCGKCDC